ncbi:MAG: Coenzyme F420 hydrogenase/dehydrogenase, beta subunit C-terminal domain [Candidatus Cryptobacteroides sp.]
MIKIEDKHKCCGCGACALACPHGCITMREDGEGFLYPYVDEGLCVECGLCETVCPELNLPLAMSGEKPAVVAGQNARVEETPAMGTGIPEPLAVLAAKNSNDEIRMSSSSGGLFTLLAEAVLNRGGVVFGAGTADDLSVHHVCVECVGDLAALRGSKYVQSVIGRTYEEAGHFLKSGREVLFSGTPCQIAGLRAYLRREYDNLLCVEVVCHGVPSYKVLMQYLSENFPDVKLTEVDFRNKRSGWKNYSVVVKGYADVSGEEVKVNEKMPYRKNHFMRGFLKDIFLRPSCYDCPFKAFASSADISLGDCWGAEKFCPEMDDDKGLSLLILHSRRSELLVNELIGDDLLSAEAVGLAEAVKYNPSIMIATAEPVERRKAFFAWDGRSFNQKIDYLCKESLLVGWRRFKYEIKLKIRKFLK